MGRRCYYVSYFTLVNSKSITTIRKSSSSIEVNANSTFTIPTYTTNVNKLLLSI